MSTAHSPLATSLSTMPALLLLSALLIGPTELEGTPTLGDPCVCQNSNLKGIYLPNPFRADQLECNCHNLSLLPKDFALVFTERLHRNPKLITRLEETLKNGTLLPDDARTTLRTLWSMSCELYQRLHGAYPAHIAAREKMVLQKYGRTKLTPREQRKFLGKIAGEPLIYSQYYFINLMQTMGLPASPNAEQLSKTLGDLLQRNLPLVQKAIYRWGDPAEDTLIKLLDQCTMMGQACKCQNSHQPGVCSINAEQKDSRGNPVCWRCRELSCNCH